MPRELPENLRKIEVTPQRQLGFDHDWYHLGKYDAVSPEPMFRGSDWARDVKSDRVFSPKVSGAAEYFIECSWYGSTILDETVVVDSSVRGGCPVLKGTTFPIATLLAELSDTSGPYEIADNFNLDVELIKQFLAGLSLVLAKPRSR